MKREHCKRGHLFAGDNTIVARSGKRQCRACKKLVSSAKLAKHPDLADKPVVIVLLDSAGKMTRVGDANRIKRWMESASLTPERRRV